MVLEELATPPPTRPVELITPQPEGGSRWFIQCMPLIGNVAGGSSPTYLPEDNCQSSALPASTSENAEEDTVIATAVVIADAEGHGQSADPEATRVEAIHRAYRNTRVSMTILKRHQGQDAEHICSFDVTIDTPSC